MKSGVRAMIEEKNLSRMSEVTSDSPHYRLFGMEVKEMSGEKPESKCLLNRG
jgi:hypothetical protein